MAGGGNHCYHVFLSVLWCSIYMVRIWDMSSEAKFQRHWRSVRRTSKAKSMVKQPCYRSQTELDKTKYSRKKKHRGGHED